MGKSFWVAVVMMAGVTTVANAGNTYFGLAYGNARNNGICDQVEQFFPDASSDYQSVKCGDDADAKQLIIGYQAWSWLAFELNYFNDLSYRAKLNYADSTVTDEVILDSRLRGASLSAVGVWDISATFALTASAGLTNWKIENSLQQTLTEDDVTTVDEIADDDNDRGNRVGIGLLVRGEDSVALRINADRISGLESGLGFDDAITMYSIGFQASY